MAYQQPAEEGGLGGGAVFCSSCVTETRYVSRRKRDLLIAFGSLGRFLRSVTSFGPDGSVFYFYLLVSCLPVHKTRYGVQKYSIGKLLLTATIPSYLLLPEEASKPSTYTTQRHFIEEMTTRMGIIPFSRIVDMHR